MAWSFKLQNHIRGHRQGPYQYYQSEDYGGGAADEDVDASDQIEVEEGPLSTSSSPIINCHGASSRPLIWHPQQTHHHHLHGNIMKLIQRLCVEIIKEYPIGHTECFYEKVLSQYLYERSIPCITQVDCFVQRKYSQVMVGRIDMEVAHTVLLELKVAPQIKQADKDQLWKYIRAKKACGMQLEHAAVICFCTSSSKDPDDPPGGGGDAASLNAKKSRRKSRTYPIEVYEADLSSVFPRR